MRAFDREKLRNLRLLRGYSLERMAIILSSDYGRQVGRSAIHHWETGWRRPGLSSLLAICDLFNVPLDYFFTEEPNYLFGKEATKADGGEG
jgi:transcriptional regulator with XRE-family HTH domain